MRGLNILGRGFPSSSYNSIYIYIILYNSNRSIASSCRRMPVWPNPCFLVASWSNLAGFLTWVQYHACAPGAVVFSCFLGAVPSSGQLSTCQVRCLRLYISYLAGLQLILLIGFRQPMGWKGTATALFRLDVLDSDSSILQTLYISENGFLHSGTTRTGLQRSLSGRN